ncbi:uncharacterized protein B4U80_09446, partial [Leptotrombidium deliense]
LQSMVNNVKKVNCDPCGICCLFTFYAILLYSDFVFVKFFVFSTQISVFKLLNCVLYQTVVILLTWSHSKASFSDPGIVPTHKNNSDLRGDTQHSLISPENSCRRAEWSVCSKCETYRPPKAHHCRICQRCIRKMDHHCPWINNCVGELNQKYFLQFLFYVGVLCLQTLASILTEYLKREKHSQSKIIHTVVLLVESLLFGIFVTAVLTDQFQAIFNSETNIERHKNTKNTNVRSKRHLLSEVFGKGPLFLWFLPCRTVDGKRSDNFVV